MGPKTYGALKQQVFKFLHNPNSKWSHLYHSFVVSVFVAVSISLNLYHTFDEYSAYYFKDYDNNTKSSRNSGFLNKTQLMEAKLIAKTKHNKHLYDRLFMVADSVIAVFLLIEFSLRVWSSNYITTYRRPYLSGFWIYYRNYLWRRSLDLFGIFVYIFCIVCHFMNYDGHVMANIRTFHLLQIFQATRILFPYFRVIYRTIFGYERRYLGFLLFSIFFIVTISSVVIYLTEMNDNDTTVTSIFTSFWYIFVTFSTIGFGDIVPVSFLSRVLVFFLTALGCFWFSLPASMIGTSLSIKIRQDFRKSIKFRQAVRLIQTVWRCRLFECSAEPESSLVIQRTFVPNHGSVCRIQTSTVLPDKRWSQLDILCLLFINRVRYRMCRYRFHRQLNMPSMSDISQQHAELWQRIDYIENDLATMSAAIDNCLTEKMTRLRTIVDKIEKDVQQQVPRFGGQKF